MSWMLVNRFAIHCMLLEILEKCAQLCPLHIVQSHYAHFHILKMRLICRARQTFFSISQLFPSFARILNSRECVSWPLTNVILRLLKLSNSSHVEVVGLKLSSESLRGNTLVVEIFFFSFRSFSFHILPIRCTCFIKYKLLLNSAQQAMVQCLCGTPERQVSMCKSLQLLLDAAKLSWT